VNSHQGDMTR